MPARGPTIEWTGAGLSATGDRERSRARATGGLPPVSAAGGGSPARSALLVVGALLLFLAWSNSFVAIGYLLGSEGVPPRFDWIGLTVGRYLPVLPLCAGFCFLLRRDETLAVLRRHPLRLVASGLLAVPAYNLALYWGQQHGVPAPIASLTTALLPLFVMLFAAAVLGERLTRRKLAGFGVSAGGLALIASAAPPGSGASYATALAVTAGAPLSWALFSILSKPVVGHESPLVWTYLTVTIGSLPLLAVAPFAGAAEMAALDAPGWVALSFLGLVCTVAGFAVWAWLLRHLPASTVGLTVFLNPPLTALSKAAWSRLAPQTFSFAIAPREWLGGAVALVGLAIAVSGGSAARRRAPDVCENEAGQTSRRMQR